MKKSTKLLLGVSFCLGLVFLSGCSQKQNTTNSTSTKIQEENVSTSEETNNLGVQSLRRAKDIKKEAEEKDRSLGEEFGL